MHLFAVFSLSLLAFAAASVKQEEGVYVLTTSNFDDFVKDNEFVLVEFYAPWCGHCKALAPEYSHAAIRLKSEDFDVKLAKVDATIESALATKYEVRGYPTLKFFSSGTPSDYTGGRQAGDIVNWLKKKTGPVAKDLKTEADVKIFVDDDEVVVVGFFKDQDSDEAEIFKRVAVGFDHIPFGITSDEGAFKEYKMKKDGVVLFKKFDEKRNDFEGVLEEGALVKHITFHQLPSVVEFNQDTAQKIFSGQVKDHLILFLRKVGGESLLEKFREAAPEFKGKVLFIYMDTDTIENERIMEFLGLKPGDTPALRLMQLGDTLVKYKPESSDIDTKTIRTFVRDFMAGKLKPHLKSEPLPDDWDAKPVKVLARENFRKVALDKSKNVFVEFYAPWCGHCKNLAPIWTELGEKYKDSKDVVIAKMDATANELEELVVNSFPTLKFFPKDDGEVVEFMGDRTLEALVKFIENGGKEDPVKAKESEDEDKDDKKKEKIEL